MSRELAKRAADRILSKNLFFCNNKDGNPVEQMIDGIEWAIEQAMSSKPTKVVVGDAEILFNASRVMVKNAMSKYPEGIQIVEELT